MNEELINRALRMIHDRYKYFGQRAKNEPTSGPIYRELATFAAAYKSAYDILDYAINNNEECLKEFDYYNDKIKEN